MVWDEAGEESNAYVYFFVLCILAFHVLGAPYLQGLLAWTFQVNELV